MTGSRSTVRHFGRIEWTHTPDGWTCTDQSDWIGVHTVKRTGAGFTLDGAPLAATTLRDACIEAVWALDYYRPVTPFDPPRIPLRERGDLTAAQLLKRAYAR